MYDYRMVLMDINGDLTKHMWGQTSDDLKYM